VVQIFTRQKKGSGADLQVAVGSIGSRSANVQAYASMGSTLLMAHVGAQKIDAPSATNPLAGQFTYNPDRDPYENTNAKLSIQHQFSPSNQFDLSSWQSRGKTDFDAGAGSLSAQNVQQLSGTALKWRLDHANVGQSRITIGETEDDIRIQSSFPGTFRTRQRQYSWEESRTNSLGTWRLGVEQRDEELASNTSYTKQQRKTDAAFLSMAIASRAWQLDANARYDREAQFGRRRTGSAALGWKFDPAHTLFVSAANAFRAPSFNDLYFPGFSNPLLKPETSRSHELSWRMVQDGFRIEIAAFNNRIENLIAFDSATFRPQNVQRARIRGVESSLAVVWADLNWRLAVTSQSPVNAESGKLLRSRAKQFASLSLMQQLGEWSWSANVTSSGSRFDSANESSTSRMGGYALLGASLHYTPTILLRKWQIALTGSNLGNRRYEVARGYEQQQRMLTLHLKWSL
jgi:vitamin B12 transporter